MNKSKVTQYTIYYVTFSGGTRLTIFTHYEDGTNKPFSTNQIAKYLYRLARLQDKGWTSYYRLCNQMGKEQDWKWILTRPAPVVACHGCGSTHTVTVNIQTGDTVVICTICGHINDESEKENEKEGRAFYVLDKRLPDNLTEAIPVLVADGYSQSDALAYAKAWGELCRDENWLNEESN